MKRHILNVEYKTLSTIREKFGRKKSTHKVAIYVDNRMDEILEEIEKLNPVYIDFMNKDKKFNSDRKSFESYEIAKVWAFRNLEKFDPDMIKYR